MIRKILEYLRGEPQHIEKLLKRGLKIGKNFCRMDGVTIDASHCFQIEIGDDVTLAPRVHILAHDTSTYMHLGYTRSANVRIGNSVFVGASTIVLPGVSIGDRVIIGAGSVVTKDIPSNSVAVGNPARVICDIDTYLDKERSKMNEENCISGLDPNNDIEGREHAKQISDKYGEIFVNGGGEKMILLSIIIPLYNSDQWLEKCLYSVLKQDIPLAQLEIICINDGSPDNSASIARGISEEVKAQNGFSPIIVLEQENQGPSGARNNGMRHASGKYLMFVDPDDYVEPNTFGALVMQMENEELDMLRFNYQIVDENYQYIEKRDFEKAFDYSPCLMTGTEFLANRLDIACNIWRYIYRTAIITKNNIWCYTGDYYDDTPWLPLVLMKAERMNICNLVVYDYLERAGSLVKGTSPRLIQRKIDGSILLLRILEEQLSGLDKLLPQKTCKTIQVGVLGWYKHIEAHMVINLLTLVALYQYENRRKYIAEIEQLQLLPIHTNKMSVKSKRKAQLINIHPLLMVWMVRLKNK